MSLLFYIYPSNPLFTPVHLKNTVLILSILAFFSCNKKHEVTVFDVSYNRVSSLLKNDSIEYALKECKTAIELAANPTELGKAYWMNGYLFDLQDDVSNSMKYYMGAADVYIHLKDYQKAAMLLENSGTIALESDAYSIALAKYQERLTYALKLNDSLSRANAYFDIGLAYKKLGSLDSSNYFNLKVLDFGKSDSILYSDALIELGIMQFHMNEFDTARVLYNQALTYDSSPSKTYKVSNNIANSYLSEEMLDEAQEWFEKALMQGKRLGLKRSQVKPINGLGKIQYFKGNNELALGYFKEAVELTSKSGAKDNQKKYDLGLFRSTKYDLGVSFQYIKELDSTFAEQVTQSIVLDKFSDFMASMVILEDQDTKRSIQLANSERNNSILTARVKRFRNERIKHQVLIAFLIVLASGLLVFISYRKRKVISEASRKAEESIRRMKERKVAH